jgi:short-subunit dehydrogenase
VADRRIRPGTVVVVLGASSGIGRATAHAFARRGARLVLAARSASSLMDAAEECRERGAPDVWAAPLDITDATAVAAMIGETRARFGRIDVWVSAASVYSFVPFENAPVDLVRRMVEVNLLGTMEAARLALPHLRESRGTLILVGSAFSELAAPYVIPYVVTKHALAGFAKGLRMEVRREVNVCTVLPATIDTPIHQHAANLTGREVRALPPSVAPERVARAIVRLAERPRRAAVVGGIQGAMLPLRRIFPGLVDAIMNRYMRLLGVRGSGVPPHNGTLFIPDPSANAVHGGWRWWNRRRVGR